MGGKYGVVDKTHGEPQIPPRLTLLGAAGAGETRVISEIAQRRRHIFGSRQSVVAAAHTGVAASNVGCGGRTADGLFRTMGGGIDELRGNQLRGLKRELEECRILFIDEISTVVPHHLASVSERIRQRAVFRPLSGA